MAPPLRSLSRTSVVAWSPSPPGRPSSAPRASPYLATATVSGALDDSFSSDSYLELWEPFAEPHSPRRPSSPSPRFAPNDTPHDESSPSSASLDHPLARIAAPARFNRIAWGAHGSHLGERPLGLIAGGMENGHVALWDPSIALDHPHHDPLVAKYETHSGPVRGIDFSSAQSNLLASGGNNGEIFVYDLSQSTQSKPFSPGPRSRSLDTITALSWNPSVVHILASGSNSGYTVVWDLKSKREITALSYAGAGPTGLGAAGFGAFGPGGGGGVGGAGGMFGGPQGGSSGVGGLGGVSGVKWHPENPTKLVTASDDDHSPVLLLWDLRNWKEPERVLRGHDKGILSVAWCKDDSDLILSSGKDGRTIAWGASTGEIVAEVSPTSNWAFDTAFCPRNSSIISTASLDGTVSLHSLQSTNVAQDASTSASAPTTSTTSSNPFDSSSVFEQAISANAANHPTKSLTHAPKWLKRPASIAFGFGGRIVQIQHDKLAPSAGAGAGGSGYGPPKVTIRRFVTSDQVVSRAERLEQASTGQLEGGLAAFCDERTEALEQEGADQGELESWRLLKTLFRAAAGGRASQNREQLIELLGYDKEGVKERIDQAVSSFRKAGKVFPTSTNATQPESVDQGVETPSVSAASQQENRDEHGVGQDEAENSLFGGNGSGAGNGGDDFFAQLGSSAPSRPTTLTDRLLAREGGSYTDGISSNAATIGSASSIASLNLKPSTFKLYKSSSGDDAEDPDRLITQALVVGDFASAVALALATDRFADALLFALRGGAELLSQTQAAYFARAQQNAASSGSASYLRILESITSNDLSDIVQNADLVDWVEVFVVLCTFAAQDDEFGSLVEQLGQRLEYQFQLVRGSPDPSQADDWRKNAILCYLAAGKLEKVVGVWVQQMKEEEFALKSRLGGSASASSSFEAHARALQDFVEKVQVFQHAVGYVDVDLQSPTQSSVVAESGARSYKLASLYERYVEYAELLAEQGLVHLAVKYIALTPNDFEGVKPEMSGPALARERLLRASGQKRSTATTNNLYQQTSRYQQPSALASSTRSAYNPYAAAPAPAPVAAQPPSTSYNPYAAPAAASSIAPSYGASNPYAAAPTGADNPYAPPPVATSTAPNPYAPKTSAYGSPAPAPPATGLSNSTFAPAFPNHAANDPYAPTGSPGTGLPAPPAVRESSPNFSNRQPTTAAAPPPPRAKPDHGWNDAPILARKSTPAAGAQAPTAKTPAITSPFPNMPSSPASQYGAFGGQPGQAVPPPPPSRGSNRTPALPPPPMAGSRFVPPPPSSQTQQQQQQQQQQQPASTAPVPPAPTTAYAPPPAATSAYAPPPAQNSAYAPPPAQNSAYAPPPPAAASNSPYAPPPPTAQSNFVPPPPPTTRAQPPQQGFPAPPPPRSGTPGQSFRAPPPPGPGRSTATPPPNAPNFPRPASANASRAPPQPQANGSVPPVPQAPPQFQARPPPPPQGQGQGVPSSGFAPPPPPPQAGQPRPAPPPQFPGQQHPPQNFGAPPPPRPISAAGNARPPAMTASAPPPPASQPRPEPPKLKYPPGDRTHIPSSSRPIFDILTLELRRLRQTTPPQQAKMINDTEKRLNILFDLLNCESLPEGTVVRVLDVCRAIEARNQALALDLHLQMLTAGPAPGDVAPFQAALKLVIQRMPPQ
ncbi:hypothetical protein JCM10212_004922 [Sporobolomyces blumeae]